MACPNPETLLEFVGGQLAAPAAVRFEEHLDSCESCRELVAHAARASGLHVTPRSFPAAAGEAPAIGGLVNYRLEGLLSQGGQGVVWRARDLRLDRLVALKQVRLDDPRATARFAREMRITARLQHPSIVKLHEAGASAEGEQFYTMELIDGPTMLESIERAGSLAARLALLPHAIAIAEALAYAHDRRVIHRDLKPANVVVGAFGETVILDWGLAKDLSANEADGEDPALPPREPGATAAGTVLGTPSYMPPEQAGGQPADERSDVYAIGAILYHLLTGQPPYAGGTSAEVLRRIASEDPAPLGKQVPRDLAAIVRRAMARAREARYPTAKELARDLRAFATGELVGAHRYGLRELAGHWVRRHRALAASAAIALVFAALWIRWALAAREQQRLVHQFAQEAETIDSALRIAGLMPLHDVRPERAKVRERMRSLEQKLAVLDSAAQGPGRYALGRGALALHDPAAARDQLERAWASGYRAPEVALALGQALGEQYQAALEEAESTESASARDERRKTAEKDLRDPALAYLGQGREAATAPRLAEAQLAFYQGRHEEALAAAEAALHDDPSLYEAARLSGDALTRMTVDRRERGDADAARTFAGRARDAYLRAVEIGRSDELGWLGECNRNLQLLLLAQDRGQAPDTDASAGLRACDQALVANPDSARARILQSSIYLRIADYHSIHGVDPVHEVELAIERARDALRGDPKNALAWYNIGSAWHSRGRNWEWRHGIDPRPSLLQAIDSFERAISIRPTGAMLIHMSRSHWAIGQYEAKHGGDPQPQWELAIQNGRRGVALDARSSEAWNALGLIFQTRAEWEVERGLDPRPSADGSIEALRKAIELKPDYAYAFNNIGVTLWIRALWERALGIDCTGTVDESVRAYRRTLALMPSFAYGYTNIADSYEVLARQQVDRGLDPAAPLADARAALEAGLGLNRKNHYNYLQRASIELLAARHSGGPLDRPLADVATAAGLNPQDADAPRLEAEIRRWRAERLIARRGDAAAELRRGLDAAERALALDAKLSKGLAVKGALLALQSRIEPSASERAALAEKSRELLLRARQLNPLLARDYPP